MSAEIQINRQNNIFNGTIEWVAKMFCIPLCTVCNENEEIETLDTVEGDLTLAPVIQQMDKPIQRNPMPLHTYALITRDQVATEK